MQLTAPVQASVDRWHAMVASGDMTGLDQLVHPDAVFRSPMAHRPYESSGAVILVLSTVIEVFEDFTYHRQFATADGSSVTLEFSARVGDRRLKGVDLIRFNADGQIVEFEVMVRPMSGLQALGDEMGRRVGAKLSAFADPNA